MAADVYSTPPHVGRGGWTWYTGSAAWMYRVAVESILGFELRGDRLHLDPCIPASWPDYDLTLRRGRTSWKISVKNPCHFEHGVIQIVVDGEPAPSLEVHLVDDQQQHSVDVILGDFASQSPKC